MNLPNNVIYQVIQNLINEQDDEEEKVTFKHDGETRTITKKTARQYASDIKQGDDSEEKQAAVKAANLDKDGKQDILKAIHYCEMIIERDYNKGEQPMEKKNYWGILKK